MTFRSKFRVLWTAAFYLLLVMIVADLYWYLKSYKSPYYVSRRHYGLQPHVLHSIETPNCNIPILHPFDKTVEKFIVKLTHQRKCSNLPALTEVVYNVSTEETRLQILDDVAVSYSKYLPLSCCAIEFYNSLDVRSLCNNFNNSLVIKKETPFLAVYCYDRRSVKVYKNIHAAIVKSKHSTTLPKDKLSKLNVLLIGFDSMSRSNLHRTMPQTVDFFQSEGWIEMKGYNKIEDNTLPNLMAVLTGMPPGSYSSSYWSLFDNLPFIWKDFSSAGYVTAYAEDTPNTDTFHCHMLGFSKPPTDHYARNFFVAGERHFMNGPETCIGYKSPSQHVFNYILDYVTIYKESPFFGLFWVNHFSHNNLNLPSLEDKQVLQFLRQLKNTGTFNTTLVVFLSDHGLRIGKFRESRVGWYEDRLPFLFISLPIWNKLQHFDFYSNILDNSDRLTTPYDLYLTLRHILYRDDSKRAVGCKSCNSMMREVFSKDRSCTSVGISPHWCTCQDSNELISTSSFVLELAEFIIPVINDKIAKEKPSSGFHCATLKLHRVVYARRKVPPADDQYIVAIETVPGLAVFEATVIDHEHGYTVDEAMSRLNDYGGTSHCVENASAKPYCYCITNGRRLK